LQFLGCTTASYLSDTQPEERIVRLSDNKLVLAELENSGVAPFLPEFCKTEAALAEIRRLLSPIRHEGHTVPYGFIFAKTKGCVEQLTASRKFIQHKDLTPEGVRRLGACPRKKLLKNNALEIRGADFKISRFPETRILTGGWHFSIFLENS
jgi:hypothetical protein